MTATSPRKTGLIRRSLARGHGGYGRASAGSDGRCSGRRSRRPSRRPATGRRPRTRPAADVRARARRPPRMGACATASSAPPQAHRDDGTAVPLGGARLRALLAALALRPGRPGPAGDADRRGVGRRPAGRRGRRAAGAGRPAAPGARATTRSARRTAATGSRAVDDDVDLHRFERLVDDGGRALADGDPGKAAGLLADALALWRGPAARRPARPGRRTPPAARRCTPTRYGCGSPPTWSWAGPERVLPELAALCAEQPLDEPLHAAAPARPARRGPHRRRAGRLRRAVAPRLADRLGHRPGPRTARAARRAAHLPARGRPRPGPPVPAPPAAAAAGRRRQPPGPAHQLRRPRGRPRRARRRPAPRPGWSPSPARAAPARPGCRRRPPSGSPTGWPDGVWLAELAPLADPRDRPRGGAHRARAARDRRCTPARTRRWPPRPARRTRLRSLTEYCANRTLLLVLDNCEHVIDACAPSSPNGCWWAARG